MGKTWVLLKKEFTEFTQPRALSLLAVFLLFGAATPVMFYFLPEILKASGQGALLGALPAVDQTEIFRSFLSSLSQLGLLAMVFVSAGMVTEERAKGVTSLLVARSVSRSTYLGVKLLAALALFLGCYLISVVLMAYGTWAFFLKLELVPLMIASLYILVYYILVTVVGVAGGALFEKLWSAGLGGVGFLILTGILPGLFPAKIAVFFPISLQAAAMKAVRGLPSWGDAWPGMVGVLILSTLVFVPSLVRFTRTEL